MIRTFIRDNKTKIETVIYGKMPKTKHSLTVPYDHPVVNTEWGAFFQSCWKYEFTNGKPSDIYVDMEMARELYRDYLRHKRNLVIESYDLNTTKAMERNDTDRLRYISKIKQYLRDMPSTIDLDSAKTAEELHLIRPHILFGPPPGENELLPQELRNNSGEAKKYGW